MSLCTEQQQPAEISTLNAIYPFPAAYQIRGCRGAGATVIEQKVGHTLDMSPICRRANRDRQAFTLNSIQTLNCRAIIQRNFNNHMTPSGQALGDSGERKAPF